MSNVLLIEDDKIISSSIKYYLDNEGFNTSIVDNEKDALNLLENNKFNIILLDITLGNENGFELFNKIKKIYEIPIIFLTALDEEVNVVRGLEMGADDYVTKPFRARELLSRIKNVIRRTSNNSEEIIYKNIKVNVKQAKVYKDGEHIFLTTLEYKLLLILLENRGKILSREKILSLIWDVSEEFVNDNTLSVYIKRLREKIEVNSNEPSIIITVRGQGYMIGE